jgi:uncharacterized Zn-binding protein involved in type VI secretion
MPGQGRLGDKANIPSDAHGCPACPHPAIGPAISGSPDVNVNGLPALRVDDAGVHAACCGPNTWQAAAGSCTVFINGKAAHRIGDATRHCGGSGKLVEGSANVIVGDSGGGGGGGGEGAATSSAAPPPGPSEGSQPQAAVSAHATALNSARGLDQSSQAAAPTVPAAVPVAVEPPIKTAWVEIELVDEEGKPVPGEEYRIELPDGSIRQGRLNDKGKARLEGIDSGNCLVTFPYLDDTSWQ